MRVLLNATGDNLALAPLINQRPAPLFCIVNKPMIVHVIEKLVLYGVREFDIVLHHLPNMIENYLEEGKRWGVQMTFHLATEPGRFFAAIIPATFNWDDETVIIGDAEILPKLPPKQFEKLGGGNSLFFHGSRGWIGWATLATGTLRHLDKTIPYAELPTKLKSFQKVLVTGVLLSVKTLHDWHTSNQRALSRHAPISLFPTTTRMIEPGIWISRSTMLHPSAVIKSPVFIGDGCQIMEGAQIGPDAVIESHCIIDKHSAVARSIVCRGSYVGENLEIYHCIVNQRTLINLALNTSVSIQDDFILGQVRPPSLTEYLMEMCQSLTALFILFLVAPLFAALVGWCGIKTSPIARLPISEGPLEWTSFNRLEFARRPFDRSDKLPLRLIDRLPSLINVLHGEMRFVGLPPRSINEVKTLPGHWRRVVLKSEVGWITTTDLEPTVDPCTSETFYVAHYSFLTNLKLLFSKISEAFSSHSRLFKNDH